MVIAKDTLFCFPFIIGKANLVDLLEAMVLTRPTDFLSCSLHNFGALLFAVNSGGDSAGGVGDEYTKLKLHVHREHFGHSYTSSEIEARRHDIYSTDIY